MVGDARQVYTKIRIPDTFLQNVLFKLKLIHLTLTVALLTPYSWLLTTYSSFNALAGFANAAFVVTYPTVVSTIRAITTSSAAKVQTVMPAWNS